MGRGALLLLLKASKHVFSAHFVLLLHSPTPPPELQSECLALWGGGAIKPPNQQRLVASWDEVSEISLKSGAQRRALCNVWIQTPPPHTPPHPPGKPVQNAGT